MSTQLQKSLLHAIEKTGRGVFLGENLDAMRAYYEIAQHKEDRKIDLCYIDPPFNSQRNYNVIYRDSVADKRVAQEGFSDVWSKYNFEEERRELEVLNHHSSGSTSKHKQIESYLDCIKDIATESHLSYLHFMAVRIWYIWLLLKDTGSFYLHCDPTMSHYLKQLCDIIFGTKNFINEIVWYYNSGARGKRFGKRHDIIFWYAKTSQYVFNKDSVRVPYSPHINIPASKAHYYHPDGKVCDDVWQIPIISQNDKRERKGYPTQKPEALLERIILASSQEGELVVDFFAGAGTVPRVAERLARRWLAFDKQATAIEIIEKDVQAKALRLTRNLSAQACYSERYFLSK